MGPQSHGSPNFSNFGGLPLGSPGTKCHLDVGLVERHKVYYNGEGGGFPQVRGESYESELLVTCFSTKNAPTMH
jgi:hypothetical protein